MREAAGIRDAWHGVQFYDDDHQLGASVSDYLGAGCRAGDTLLVVSTPEHWSIFSNRLRANGHDVDAAKASGQLITLDARETLSQIVRDSMPDEGLFRAMMQPLLASSAERNPGRIRIYGEMVNLLWQDGNTNAAIAIEELWNGLHESDSFWLLCGYASAPCHAHSTGVQSICAVHTHVIKIRVSSETRSIAAS